MTIRDKINKERKAAMTTCLIGFFIFICAAISASYFPQWCTQSMLGVGAVFAVIGIILLRIYKCPKCSFHMYEAGTYTLNPFKLSDNQKFCPSCGISLDCEMEEDQNRG